MIDLDEIQSIVIRPSSAATVDLAFVRLPDREAMRIFLRHAAEAVTTAAEVAARGPSPVDGGPASRSDAVCVGLTADGVRLAGVGGRALGALPATFLSGMRAAADRLGDVGPSAPATWPAPFSGRAVVHAVVLRFGAGGLGRLAGWIPPDDATTWRGARLPGHREPFGFRDGISDPVIEGSGRKVHPGNGVWDAGRGRWRAVRTGEAVLGYTDESGEVAGHRDAAQLEVNGSYLVIRKLEQDVSGFHEECARWAEELGVTADDVAAQMVGRHRDGTVLGRRPPARGNDFLYTAEGGVGRDVPPSAHIRRANPRDDPIVGENLVRRHLMFRRGYPYDDGGLEGAPLPRVLRRPRPAVRVRAGTVAAGRCVVRPRRRTGSAHRGPDGRPPARAHGQHRPPGCAGAPRAAVLRPHEGRRVRAPPEPGRAHAVGGRGLRWASTRPGSSPASAGPARCRGGCGPCCTSSAASARS